MDAVDRAIKNNRHLIGGSKWINQQWKSFYEEIPGKKLFVFGVGAGLSAFFFENTAHMEIEAVIDNNDQLRPFRVSELVSFSDNVTICHDRVMNKDILRDYPNEQIVVLITSLRYYGEIADQLMQSGISRIYSYLSMEANKRQADGSLFCHRDATESYPDYAMECAKKPLVSNKIVFEVSTYGETARRVTECLRKCSSELDIVWIVSRYDDHPDSGIRCIHRNNWKQYIYEMETAAVWAWETIIPPYIVKREGQIYIYLKHWSITLKNVGPNIVMADSDWYDKENQVRNANEMDYVFGCSRFDRESFLTSYGVGNVVDVGSPKADKLFNVEQNRTSVYNHYDLDEHVRIAIYAPTFRWKLDGKDSFDVTAERISIDYGRLKKALIDRFGGQWIICVRLHPAVAAKCDRLNIPADVLNTSKYRRAEELISAADVIITDYSSVMFEAGFLLKPVFLYATDRKEYIERERDILLDYDQLPFSVAESDAALEQNIAAFDEDKYKQELRTFLDELGSHEDGHSGERAAQFIMGIMDVEMNEK